jgi:hypothetical protein
VKVIYLILIFSTAYGQITRSLEQDEPAYLELGAGITTFTFPDYPGSSNSQVYLIPYPAAFVRGDTLRADEEGGIRGRFLSNPDYELSFSGSLNFSSDADDNPVRAGMPRLETLVELGPSILIRLKKSSKNSPMRWTLSLPLRFAFTTDLKKSTDRGLVFNPFVFSSERIFGGKTLCSLVAGTFALLQLGIKIIITLCQEFSLQRPDLLTKLKVGFSNMELI